MSNKKMTLLASVGASFEYYDFMIYGLLAGYIGKNFFPVTNGTTQLLEAFSIFALGYLVRPIGGIIFGNQGDRVGRKPMFMLSILLMGSATFLIGLLPNYHQIGITSTFLLIILRMIQGLAFGSEIPGTITFLIEHNQRQHRGMHTGLALSSVSLGAALGVSVVLILDKSLTTIQMNDYGWRLPFILGGVFALISFFIRNQLQETPVFLSHLKNQPLKKEQPIFKLLRHYPKYILLGTGICLLSACLIVFGVSMPAYLQQFSPHDTSNIYFYSLIGFVWAAFSLPIFGWTSDKIGQIKQLTLTVVLLIVVIASYLIAPELYAPISLAMCMIIYQTFVASLSSSYLPVLAEMFPVNIRFTGVAFCYNLAYAIAGFSPLLITKF